MPSTLEGSTLQMGTALEQDQGEPGYTGPGVPGSEKYDHRHGRLRLESRTGPVSPTVDSPG